MSEDLIIQVKIDSRPAEAGRDAVVRTLADIKAAAQANSSAISGIGKSGADAFDQLRVAAERQLATLTGTRREYELARAAMRGVTEEQIGVIRGIHSEIDAQRGLQQARNDAAVRRSIQQARDVEALDARLALEKALNQERAKSVTIQENRDVQQQEQRWAVEKAITQERLKQQTIQENRDVQQQEQRWAVEKAITQERLKQQTIQENRDVEIMKTRLALEKEVTQERAKQQAIQESRDMELQRARWAAEKPTAAGPPAGATVTPFALLGMPDPDELKTRTAALKSAMDEIDALHRQGKVSVDQHAHAVKNYHSSINSLAGASNTLERSGLHRILASLASASFIMGGAAAGVTALGAALGSPVIAGMGHLRHIEDVQQSMGGIIESVARLDKAVMTTEQARDAARSIVADLQVQSNKYGVPLDDLVSSARVALSPGLQGGMGLEDISRLATLATLSVKQLGLDARQVIQETRALITGSGNVASATLRSALNVTMEETKEAIKQGKLLEFYEGRMAGFINAAADRPKTMTGAIDQLKTKTTLLFADREFFESLKTSIMAVSSAIGEFDQAKGKLVFTEDAKNFAKEFLDTVKFLGTGLSELVGTIFKFRSEIALALESWAAFKVGSKVLPLAFAGAENLIGIAKSLAAIPGAMTAVASGSEAIMSGALSSIDNFKAKVGGMAPATKGGVLGLVLFGAFEFISHLDSIFNKIDERTASTLAKADAAIKRNKDAQTVEKGGKNAVEMRDLDEDIGDKMLEIGRVLRLLKSAKSTLPEAESGYIQGDIERQRLEKHLKELTILEEKKAELIKSAKQREESNALRGKIRGMNAPDVVGGDQAAKGAIQKGVDDGLTVLEILANARLRAFEKFDAIINSKVSTKAEIARARKERQEVEADYQFEVQEFKKARQGVLRPKFMGDEGSAPIWLERGLNNFDTRDPGNFGPYPDNWHEREANQLGYVYRGEPVEPEDLNLINKEMLGISTKTAKWLEGMGEVNGEIAKTSALLEATAAATPDAKLLKPWQEGVKKAADDYVEQMASASEVAENLMARGLYTLEHQMVNLFINGKFEAKSFFKSVAEDITRLIIQQNLIKPIAKILGGAVEQGSSGNGINWLSLIGGAFGAYAGASGGSSAFASGGHDGAFAIGGEVARGGRYLVGEDGPEMFTPKSTGFITPNSVLEAPRASTTTVHTTVLNFSPQIDARGSDAGVQQRIDAAMEKAKVGAFNMVRSSLERGGVMHKAAK